MANQSPVYYMARDQYGATYHNLGQHPRKALLTKLGRQNAKRIYRDKVGGGAVHVGYVIAGLWLTLYQVIPFERAI